MAATQVLCGNKRSFFQDDVLPSSLHLSKRLRCSSSSFSIPPQRVTPLHRPVEETEHERFGKRAKMTHHENLSAEEWAELFVREMSSATNVNDAKARAANALQVFEQLIRSRAATEAEMVAARKEEEENMVLKQENQEMKKENMILNERLKETEGRNQEYKKRVSTLEVEKYGLQLYLKQAQQCNTSIPLGFHPHVF